MLTGLFLSFCGVYLYLKTVYQLRRFITSTDGELRIWTGETWGQKQSLAVARYILLIHLYECTEQSHRNLTEVKPIRVCQAICHYILGLLMLGLIDLADHVVVCRLNVQYLWISYINASLAQQPLCTLGNICLYFVLQQVFLSFILFLIIPCLHFCMWLYCITMAMYNQTSKWLLCTAYIEVELYFHTMCLEEVQHKRL